MKGIIWTGLVRNAEELQKVKWTEVLYKKKMKNKANYIGQILHGNCLLKLIIKGKIDGSIYVKGRQGKNLSN